MCSLAKQTTGLCSIQISWQEESGLMTGASLSAGFTVDVAEEQVKQSILFQNGQIGPKGQIG